MVELIIKSSDCGGRLDKYLKNYLKEAPSSFLYKMLRKKNIVLNGKKASGSELLQEKDEIRLFLSDETIQKFGGRILSSSFSEREFQLGDYETDEKDEDLVEEYQIFHWTKEEPEILYEDKDLLILNKPIDVLSQPAKVGDVTMNEWILHYLLSEGKITKEELLVVKPAVVNRLDRNTSGIILAGKTLVGLRYLSSLIKDRKIKKYYLTVVKGEFPSERREIAYLLKKENRNTVSIKKEQVEGSVRIETVFSPIAVGKGHSLLKVELVTGKSHQIRAHLNFLGYPVIGDGKYGKKEVNREYRRMGLKSQFLHSYEIEFPGLTGIFAHLSERCFRASLSKQNLKILEQLEMKDAFMEFEGP